MNEFLGTAGAQLLGNAVGAIVQSIFAAIEANDISTLEALAKACPRPEVFALRDEALIKAQNDKAKAELGG